MQIILAAEQNNRILQIHHGFRYSVMGSIIHEVVTSGRLGHHGICPPVRMWRSSTWLIPMCVVIGDLKEPLAPCLTKCCHDLDFTVWNLGCRSKRIVSNGSLRYFRSENARPDYPERCTDGCPEEADCPYNAARFYLSDEYPGTAFAKMISTDLSKEGLLHALKTGPYGKCVFRCDNDVVDSQITLIEMEDGTNLSLSIHGFSHDGGRSVRIQGTKGTLIAEALQRDSSTMPLDRSRRRASPWQSHWWARRG